MAALVASKAQKAAVASPSKDSDDEDLSSDEEYYRELERIKGGAASNSESQFEGGSPSNSGREVDKEQKSQSTPAAVSAKASGNAPVYKLNIKSINKGSLKIKPSSDLSNRLTADRNKNHNQK